MKVAVAVLSALALSASACYGPGERNQGAEGYPGVEYRPCCDGQTAQEKPGDWGKFCPGGGGGGGDCYGPGERNQGAEGYPQVDYKPCCDGQAAVDKAGDWGKFCPGGDGGSGDGDDCYKAGERNQGEAGYPNVEYKPCCDGKAAVAKDGDWGKFCPGGGDVDPGGTPYNPILCASVGECGCSGAGTAQCSKCPDDGGSANVNNDVCWCKGVPGVASGNECNPLKANGPTAGGDGKTCYGAGERNQGAAGYPPVEYKPCCDGKAAVEKAGDWGKFCPPVGDGGPGNGCRRRRRRRL